MKVRSFVLPALFSVLATITASSVFAAERSIQIGDKGLVFRPLSSVKPSQEDDYVLVDYYSDSSGTLSECSLPQYTRVRVVQFDENYVLVKGNDEVNVRPNNPCRLGYFILSKKIFLSYRGKYEQSYPYEQPDNMNGKLRAARKLYRQANQD